MKRAIIMAITVWAFLTPLTADPQISGRWDTSYGDLILTQHANKEVEGFYYDYKAQILGKLNGHVLTGYWIEEGNTCPKAFHGSKKWGRLKFVFSPDGRHFKGTWGYCEKTTGGNWQGTLVKPAEDLTERTPSPKQTASSHSQSHATSQGSKLFKHPTIFGDRIYWCTAMGHKCGKVVADNFCHMRGYDHAVDFAMDPDVGHRYPLRILDTALTCEKAFCDSFKYIRCSAKRWHSPGPVMRIEIGGPVRVGKMVPLHLKLSHLPRGRINIWWEVDGKIGKGWLSPDRKTYKVAPATKQPVIVRAHVTDANWNMLNIASVKLIPGQTSSHHQSPSACSSKKVPNVAGRWKSTEGNWADFTQKGRKVEGTYGLKNGKIYGTFTGNVLNGYWVQSSSGQKCSTPKYGSYYWGRVRFEYKNGKLEGYWSYCGAKPSGSWTIYR